MSRAFLSAWHNFTSNFNTSYHKIFYDYFVEKFPLWQDLVDTVYIIDNNWNFSEEDKKRLTDIKKETVFYKPQKRRYLTDFLKEVCDLIKEDQILYMDNDCFIYDRRGVEVWFDVLGNWDIVVTLSAGGDFPRQILRKYPKLIGKKDTDNDNQMTSIWLNHFLLTRKFLNNLRTWDFDYCFTSKDEYYREFIPGTYIPELDYTTKEGDRGEYACMFIYQMLASLWKDLPIIPNRGFYHFHDMHNSYVLLAWKNSNLPEFQRKYARFVKEQPCDKYLTIMSWFNIIDIQKKYDSQTKEIIFDFLKRNTRTF